ncbi:hypothetical protein KSP40_PGU015018 [Platanthera guangdongensis]|uniref:Uncharacterized protein n=1 Tax=Platanthera guangdongensis TaxID=2320717 RepID=A0ABR2N2V4_9ASPA
MEIGSTRRFIEHRTGETLKSIAQDWNGEGRAIISFYRHVSSFDWRLMQSVRLGEHGRGYEGQRDMLYNQTYNLDQVAFAAEGLKDAQQTMTALKTANKELKGMMKSVKIQDIDV